MAPDLQTVEANVAEEVDRQREKLHEGDAQEKPGMESVGRAEKVGAGRR